MDNHWKIFKFFLVGNCITNNGRSKRPTTKKRQQNCVFRCSKSRKMILSKDIMFVTITLL